MWKVVFYLVLCVGAFAEKEWKLVETAQGPVRGYKDEIEDVFVFQNIPYATAPTGDHKFRAPLPAPTWTDTFEATDKGIVCPQGEYAIKNFKGKKMQEDCLIANIYVPASQNKKLPVLVYVHGGGYFFGFGDLTTPKKLVASQQIVAVNFNYRLGPHGFLCLGTEDVPGNAGMKDQVALLRWVKKNIASFGGDPDNVTIGGGSAGSSSVDLLMLSKVTDGLFNKVIPESGSNTAALSIQPNPLENAREYAGFLNSSNAYDVYDLEKFYKSIPYENLFSDSIINITNSMFLMSPCIESETNEEAFLINSAVDILKSRNYKKLPMLYGFAEMEGLLRIPQFDTWKELMNKDFSKFLPADLQFQNEKEKNEVVKKVRNIYFGENEIDETSVLAYIDFFSDVIFKYPAFKSVNLQVEAGNNQIYLYEFSYADKSTPLIPHTNVRGATHCAQSMAVMDDLNFDIYQTPKSDEHDQVRAVTRKMWINFIVTGKPVPDSSELPEWPPVGSNWSPHMNIDLKLELRGSLLNERIQLWDEIYAKHYRTPIPPPRPARTEL